MKRLYYILMFIMLLSAIPSYGQTHLYERYAKHTNLEVAYLENFPVDSCTKVNVTIIIAKNNFMWRWLLRDLNLPFLTSEEKRQIRNGKNIIGNILRYQDNPSKAHPAYFTDNDCLLSVNFYTKHIVCYHLTSRDQYTAIINHSLKNIIKNEKN